MIQRRPNDSNLWRGTCKSWTDLKSDIKIKVGNGTNVKFWTDPWLPNVDNLLQCVNSDEPVDLGAIIADFLSRGQWNNGYFTIRSAINNLHHTSVPPHVRLFKIIWSWVGPQRIKAFLWLLANNALLSNSNRCRRHIAHSALCSICYQSDESILHVVRDCAWARNVWLHFLPRQLYREFFTLNLTDWILFNPSSRQKSSSNKDWDLTFPFVAAGVWFSRNAFLFDNSSLDSMVTSFAVHRQIEEAHCVFRSVNQQLRSDNSPPHWIRWFPPKPDWIKINSDGSFIPSSFQAGCGGLFRNHHC
ncbi:Reverse transcriptase zinc-binding domain [Sesbania bispinosa]|nr:Reverse transcriptase zinc-binding domain [Sesbania bispinosa]